MHAEVFSRHLKTIFHRPTHMMENIDKRQAFYLHAAVRSNPDQPTAYYQRPKSATTI
jgi:hypothetical protein